MRVHVLDRARGIAAAEHHAHAVLDQLADRDQAARRVDADEIAHQIITGVGARDRQPDENQAAEPVQVARELLADVLLQHVERRPVVERDDDIALRLRDRVFGSDRRAALREARRDRHVVREQHAGNPAVGDFVGDLQILPARTGEPADQKTAFDLAGDAGDQIRHFAVARIGMHDREIRRALAALEARQAEIVGGLDARKYLKRAGREIAQHHRQRRLVEVLAAGRADADADRADPVRNAGALAEKLEDVADVIREQIGDIQKTEARRRPAELREALTGRFLPVLACGVAKTESRAHAPCVRRRCGGGIRMGTSPLPPVTRESWYSTG